MKLFGRTRTQATADTNNPETRPAERALPFDVRFALQHRAGRMQQSDIEALARNGFEVASAYLILKHLAVTSRKEEYFEHFEQFMTNRQLDDVGSVVGPDDEVQGDKVGFFSQMGFETMMEGYSLLADRIFDAGESPVLIAHAPLVGLHNFIDHDFENTLILVPEWKEDAIVGLVVGPQRSISAISSDFIRPPNAHFVDFLVNTGKTFDQITDLWNQGLDTLTLPPQSALINRGRRIDELTDTQ